jgi:AcrR family transcriptional regulator
MPKQLPGGSTPRRPRWRRRAAARPEELLDAALEVFAERGFARARLEDVGLRAGVTKGTVYLYFDSKEALFRELVRTKVASSIAAGEQFVRDFQGPTPELLVGFIHRYWEVMMRPANARLARVLLSELGNFPDLTRFYLKEVGRVRGVIATIIERGIARGEFRPISPALASRALQILCVHLAQQQSFPRSHEAAPLEDAEVLGSIVDLYLHGVLARPTKTPDVRTSVTHRPR